MGRDDVDTLGFTLNAQSAVFTPAPWASLRLQYGADTYLDFVASKRGFPSPTWT